MAVIEYVYSAHSAFAYIGSAELGRICSDHGATLVHKPVILSHVLEAKGRRPVRERTQAHVDYFFGREIERWAEHRGVPIVDFRPTRHDADYSLASGLILALGETGKDVDRMAHALLEAHWRHDADLSDTEALGRLCAELEHDPVTLLEAASSEPVQDKLKENTIRAGERPVFGSPTYIVDGDPFFGQDRLELVERALSRPFAAPTFRNPPIG